MQHKLERLLFVAREEGIAGVLTPETKIEELGLDSLEFMSFLTSIRTEMGAISDQDAVKANTLSELAAAIEC